MKILALDSSTMMASIAVLEGNKILGEYSLNQEESHSEALISMIKEMLDELNIKISDIDLFAVAKGPGSFTGLRIGIASMKSFAHLFGKPIIGISTLEAMAMNLGHDGLAIPMLDARRNRVYTGLYRIESGNVYCEMNDDAVEIADLIKILSEKESVFAMGNGTEVYGEELKEALASKIIFLSDASSYCRAPQLGLLAHKKFLAGEVDDCFTLVPEYIRESQAERELKERENKK